LNNLAFKKTRELTVLLHRGVTFVALT